MKLLDFSAFKAILVIYALAMGLSYYFQIAYPGIEKEIKYQQVFTVSVEGLEIDLEYLHVSNQEAQHTLFMLPDYLDNPEFLLPLAESLNDHFEVIIPIYPVTDTSGNTIEHSNEFRAKIIDAFMDSINVDTIDLLGYGYGGLVTFNILSDSGTGAEKVRSLILLSSFGPIELHFLGNHTINRSLYTLLYPAVTLFKYFTPHLGWYDEQPINFSFINTLLEMDQRDVRSHVEQIDLPVLILHPVEDNYVSLSVAQENHRLIPQSILATQSGGHQQISDNPDLWKYQIEWFVDLAEQNEALIRDFAENHRIEKANEPFDASQMETIGGWALIIIIGLLALFTLISEDLACIGGGLIVASGVVDFWYAVLGCFLGIFIIDIFAYLMGRWIGSPVLKWVPFRWFLKTDDVAKAERMFNMKGVEIIFATRFIPASRFPTYLVAGMLKTKFWFFLFYFTLSIAIWTPLLVGLSALIGQPMIQYIEVYQDYAIWIFLLIVVVIYLIMKIIIPLTTVTGRRKLVVKWGRFKESYFG